MLSTVVVPVDDAGWADVVAGRRAGAAGLGQSPASYMTMRRTLGRAQRGGYRDRLTLFSRTRVGATRGCDLR